MYLIHEPDPETPLDETLRALDDLVRLGKVLYVGASNIEAWRLARSAVDQRQARPRALRLGAELVQPARSHGRSVKCCRLCADQGVGFTAFSPLAGGWLTGKYRAAGSYPDASRMTLRPEPYRHLERDGVFRGLAAFDEEARVRGVEMSALAMAWVLHHPRVDAAITGSRTVEQLDSALASTAIDLSADDVRRLSAFFEPEMA